MILLYLAQAFVKVLEPIYTRKHLDICTDPLVISADQASSQIRIYIVFLTYKTEFVLFLAVLENSVLPKG